MKFATALFALFLCSGGAGVQAEMSAPEQLADLTAKNVALVSVSLEQHRKGVNDIAASRVKLMLSVHRMAADARAAVDREMAVLKQTGGTDLVKLFDALREHGNQAVLVPGRLDAEEAATKADITAAYTPLVISTEKLDQAAKKLATLSAQQTKKERAQFALQFLKETRAEVEKLQEDSTRKKESGDAMLANKVGSTTAALTTNASK